MLSGGQRLVTGRELGNPWPVEARSFEDVDPNTGALPVLEAGETTEMLAGGGCWISLDPLSQPPLRTASLCFLQDIAAQKPQVASALHRGAHDQGVVLVCDSVGYGGGKVIE